MTGGIGDPQVRNWGTIGGSVAHADPASDWPAVLLAANARVVCRGGSGERVIGARDFFLGTFETAIEPTEVLTEIRFAKRPRHLGGSYVKLERKVGDFATVGVATRIQLGDDGTITGAGIGVTGVADTPFAATDGEAALVGSGAVRRRVPSRRRRRRGPEPPIRGHPRTRRLQARDGRRADPAVTPAGRRTRRRVRVAGEPR